MRTIIGLSLIFVILFPLAGQSLPEDLKAAAILFETDSPDPELLGTMMHYKSVQKEQLEKLIIQRDRIVQRKKTVGVKRKFSWASLIAGALAGGAFGLFTILGNDTYSQYMATTDTNEVGGLKDSIQLYQTLRWVSLGVGGTLTGTGGLLFLVGSSSTKLDREHRKIDAEIKLLEGAVQ